DEIGQVEIEVNPNGSYDYFKNGLPIEDTYTGLPENFELLVEQEGTGCIKRLAVEMPSFNPVSANFNYFPAGCINTYKNELSVEDLSTGAIEGYWFLAGQQLEYFPGEKIDLKFDSAGNYELQLVVFNEGGCIDSLTREICVEPFSALQVPNAFSPNGDGVNDVFEFHTIGISEIHWMIFDRYGKMLFESFDENDSWNGETDGQPGPVQNYLLVLSYTDLSGNTETARYNVQLVR
ncbi:MAG TPA: T9SS type B sorting domain-containing protein, partial [Saprospiraceae bacterium]|nr:T9SS type B sorting domain-containing protein [Saprospiraceae bacterium]